jgi:hypothetical protein
MTGGSALAELRARLPLILRGGALVSAGAIVGLGLGVAIGMPGMIGGAKSGPQPRARAAKPPAEPELVARAPEPAPTPAEEPQPIQIPDPNASLGPTAPAPQPSDPALVPPTPQPAPGPSAPGAGTEVIQVAATPFRPLADAVRKRLTDVGYQSYVDTVVLEGRQRFRVRVDSAGRDAQTVAKELKALGYPVWVTQE